MRFKKVLFEDLTAEQVSWLKPAAGVRKISFERMMEDIKSGRSSLWLLGDKAEGLAVTYPYLALHPNHGLLFIYYLHGRGLFGTLNKEQLLEASRHCGFKGMTADVESSAMKRILERLGFHVTVESPYGWSMELHDG